MKTNHTIMIVERGWNIWVTLLTSHDPKVKEYRFTFSDGVIRYATMSEIIQSEFNYIGYEASKLTAIDESKIGLFKGEFYSKY